jgi:hypothetical protein
MRNISMNPFLFDAHGREVVVDYDKICSVEVEQVRDNSGELTGEIKVMTICLAGGLAYTLDQADDPLVVLENLFRRATFERSQNDFGKLLNMLGEFKSNGPSLPN